MGKIEDELKELILSRYRSVREFTNSVGIPYSTFDSILKRGIANANISNILKITKALSIDTEDLAAGKITPAPDAPRTLAAHFDGEDFTQEELEDIRQFAEFVKNRRRSKP